MADEKPIVRLWWECHNCNSLVCKKIEFNFHKEDIYLVPDDKHCPTFICEFCSYKSVIEFTAKNMHKRKINEKKTLNTKKYVYKRGK